jgi:hypothetical protein
MHDGESAHDIEAARICWHAVLHDFTRPGIDHAKVMRDCAAFEHRLHGAGEEFLSPGFVHRCCQDGGLDALPGFRLGEARIHGVAEEGTVQVVAFDVEDRAHVENRARRSRLAYDIAGMVRYCVEILHGAAVNGFAEFREIEMRGGGSGHEWLEKQRFPRLRKCRKTVAAFSSDSGHARFEQGEADDGQSRGGTHQDPRLLRWIRLDRPRIVGG